MADDVAGVEVAGVNSCKSGKSAASVVEGVEIADKPLFTDGVIPSLAPPDTPMPALKVAPRRSRRSLGVLVDLAAGESLSGGTGTVKKDAGCLAAGAV